MLTGCVTSQIHPFHNFSNASCAKHYVNVLIIALTKLYFVTAKKHEGSSR